MIQDLIDQGDITVDDNKRSANIDHTIFKDPFVKHDKEKASHSGTQDNTANYTNYYMTMQSMQLVKEMK